MSRTVWSVALLLCAVAGCEGQPSDTDLRADHRPADRATTDGTGDMLRPLDLGAPGERLLAADGLAADRTVVDAGLPRDTSPMADKNTSPDKTSSTPPCAAGVATAMAYGKVMAICGPGGAVNQCTAASLCGAGWHLCTASEYLARGGTSTPGIWGARLASCVRENNAVFAPTDKLCAICDSIDGNVPSVAVAWACSGGTPFAVPHLYVGAVTHTGCYRLGVNDPQHAAYWGPLSTGSHSNHAVCCN
jgi:hypothetical protein